MPAPLRPTTIRRACLSGLALVSLGMVLASAPSAQATTESTVATGTEQTTGTDSPDTTTNDFLDLERSLTECISSNPPPGCGRAPTSPGDRGGWQQLLLFGVMTGGIAVIFWRVARSVRRRDAALQSE